MFEGIIYRSLLAGSGKGSAESLFRTLKYVPQWPSSGFKTPKEARIWVDKFTRWYNEEHRHSGIGYVTPVERYRGEDRELLKKRDDLYRQAQKAHPNAGQGRQETGSRKVLLC